MVSLMPRLRSVFSLAGLVLLLVAGLVLFAVLAIAMRPLLIVALVLASVGCVVLCFFSPGFRHWFETVGEKPLSFSGLRLATDVAMHPSHSWARVEKGGVAVGADDLVQAALGPVEGVELPAVGSHVEQGDPLFTLRRGDRSVAVRAPVSGDVVAANEALRDRPHLVNEDPFTRGWVVRIRADHVLAQQRHLLEGGHARGWFRKEVDRLIATILGDDGAMPSLADGGALVEGLYQHIDDETWDRVQQTFFGTSPSP